MENRMEEELKKDDSFWEENNSKGPMLIIIAILLVVTVLGVMYIKNNRDLIPKPNISTNSDDIITKSDDVSSMSDDNTLNDNVVYIYAEGFADNGPIAFTYNCLSNDCNIITTEKGLILYDEGKVQYRKLTQYEYDQIYNSDSPVGEKLDKDGFEEIKRFKFDSKIQTENEIYIINNQGYIVDNKTLKSFDEYNKQLYDGKLKEFTIIDNIVYIEGILYDYKNNKKITELNTISPVGEYGKKGKFYYFQIFEDEVSMYLIIDDTLNYTNVINDFGINIDDDKVYYIEFVMGSGFEVNVINNKNEKIEYEKENINSALYIYDDNLLYLDKENNISVKKLLNEKILYNSNVKCENCTAEKTDAGFELFQVDTNIINNEDFDKFRKSKNITDDEMFSVKSCIENRDTCELQGYDIGYLIKLDKEGKYLSKEYYIKIY